MARLPVLYLRMAVAVLGEGHTRQSLMQCVTKALGDIKEEWDLHASEFLQVGFGHRARVFGPGGHLMLQPVHVGRASEGRMCVEESQR